jgi:hypothetical protein
MRSGVNQFIEDTLGAKLKNRRWSWGAVDPVSNRVFLRVWEDNIKEDGAAEKVVVYWKNPAREQSHGYVERRKHIDAIKSGAQGFGVVCRALDPHAKPRTIAEFDANALIKLGDLSEDDRAIYAQIVKWIPISELN